MKDRKMPPKTLRVKIHQDFGCEPKEFPIYFNKPQMDLLAATEKYGMTPAIINTWIPVKTDGPGYLCDEKARNGYWSTGEYLWSDKRGTYIEFKNVSHSSNAYGLMRDTLFTKGHQAAAVDLICNKKIKPLDAITIISHVSGDEALLIARFLDVGLTNAVLIANRDHQIYRATKHESIGDTYYATALDFLIRKQQLSLKEAMHELQYLSPSQMKVLVDLYADGLRGDDIRQVNDADACKKYADMMDSHGDWYEFTVEYFKKLFRDNVHHGKKPAEALMSCTAQLPKDNQLRYSAYDTKNKKFALKYFDQGVRESDLSSDFAEPEARKAFASLRFLAKLSVADAVAELRGLDVDKMTFLRKHYRHGVRNKHLVDIGHRANDVEFLMRKFDMTPLQALGAAHALTTHQMGYLHAFAGHGLTIDEAKSLQLNDGINRDRRDVALFLVDEKSYGLVNAIQHVAEKSGHELLDLMKEDSLKMNSIRL